MGILARLSWGRTARLVAAALEAARATDGPILVTGAPGLARVLAERGLTVLALGKARPPVRALAASLAALPLAQGALAALVVRSGAPPAEEWGRALRPGGALVLVAAHPAAEQSRRALCAGLVDLEQRRSGRLVVTSGRTWGGGLGAAR